MENYEKKYKNALEWARQIMNGKTGFIRKEVEEVFPELRESEDEKSKKWILEYLYDGLRKSDEQFKGQFKAAIAWLEKQGEKNLANSTKTCKDEPFDYENANIQQKDFAPKEEPKFNMGQWIVWQNKCYKVNYNGCGYELVDQNGLSTSLEYGTIDENAHLWDITKDVKDGDVLSNGTTIFIFKDLLSDSSVMSYCDYDTDSGESDAFCPLSVILICSKITPATKEQRDTLMKAMADAGYTFDFEKKELKKIEQKSQRMISAEAKEALYDKPVWSEDDEKILGILIDEFEDYSESDAEWWKGLKVKECTKWPKSLKNRIQLKQEWSDKDAMNTI